MLKMLCVFLLASLLPATSFSVSQQTDSKIEITKPAADVALTPGEQEAKELKEAFPNTEFCKCVSRKDADRYLFDHDGKPLKITAYNDGQFKIQLTREFSNHDIDELADAHPDLLKYVADVPDQTENEAKVKVRIETEVTYQFDNEMEFDREQPELCSIYRGHQVAETE